MHNSPKKKNHTYATIINYHSVNVYIDDRLIIILIL